MTRLSLLIAVLATACATPAPQPVEPDQTVASKQAPAPKKQEIAEFTGVVSTRKSAIVPVPFSGKLLKLDASAGKRIKKGEQLAKLDDQNLKSDIAASISEEKSQRSAAGAAGALAAQANLEASRMMRGGKAFAGMAIKQKQAEAASQGAQAGAAAQKANAARNTREKLERQLAQTSITSPLDGVIMMVKAREGQIAQEGEPLARVFDDSDLLMRFAVPKEWRKSIHQGDRVQLKIEGVDSKVWATIETITDEEAPIDFAVVEADIDDSKLAPGEIQIAAPGKVYLADNKLAARKAVR